MVKERHRLRKFCDDYLQFGGFPETSFVEDVAVRKEILVMYARNILYQDIVPRFAVKKAVELEDLFFYLASNVASLYTFNKLADLVGLNDKTVKEFLGYFHDAYLLFALDLFAFSAKEQVKSPKKVYTIDTGMAGAVGFNFTENIGHLLENQVFLELKRRNRELYYYKTANGLEVDFVCRQGGKITQLIQVAREIGRDKTRNRELRALRKAMDETGLKEGLIVTLEDEEEITPEGKTVQVVPAYKYLLNVTI
jgi:predicted AAA+ superfamily ATPase